MIGETRPCRQLPFAMLRGSARLWTGGILALGLVSQTAAAQEAEELPDFALGRTVLPVESIAVGDDGHSAYFNPAGPGFSSPNGFEFYQTFMPSATHKGPGDVGRGLFLSFSKIRFGWQVIGTEAGPSYGLLYMSNARVVRPGLSFGTSLNYHYYLHTETPTAGLLGMNLGFQLRPLKRTSFGLVFENLLTPQAQLPSFRTRGTLGVGFRPFGDKLTLTADAGVRLAELTTNPVLNVVATARVEPVRGFQLHGSFELLDATSDTSAYVLGLGGTMRFGKFLIGDQGYLNVTPGGTDGTSTALATPVADSLYVGFSGVELPTALKPGGVRGRVLGLGVRGRLLPPEDQDALTGNGATIPMLQLLQRLTEVEHDPSIRGAILFIEPNQAGLSDMQELAAQVKQVRASGKKVIAHLTAPSARDLVLAAACDRVILHPASDVELIAPRADTLYWKEAFDRYGVGWEAIKTGAFKSAPEQYTHTEPSPEAREMMKGLLDDLYDQLISTLAEGRKLPAETLTKAFEGGMLTPREALEMKLVDAVRYPDELEEELTSQFGRKLPIEADSDAPERVLAPWGPQYTVGLVYFGGTISRGSGGSGLGLGDETTLGSREAIQILKRLAQDPRVRAVVIRVDSPGGSLLASDEIWHAIRQVQKKKPVVVSMGRKAASGGYYISLPADAILASPATLTGSIGVFSSKPNLEKLLEKYGVHAVTQGPDGTAPNYEDLFHPWTDTQRSRIQASIDEGYKTFLKRVGESRRLSVEQLEPLAGGRVWTGRQAVQRGLVDRHGGLQEAIDLAVERAGIRKHENVVIEVWPELKLSEALFNRLKGISAQGMRLERMIGRVLGKGGQLEERSAAPQLEAVPLPEP